MGAEVLAGDLVADDLGEVASTLAQAAVESDLVITTGGTAAGPRDHLRAAIERNAGKILVDCVAVRPGHPMLLAEFATHDSRRVPIIGLPGNPHSAIVGLLTLAEPLIDAMLGRPRTPLAMVSTASELRAPKDHTRLIAGNLVEGRFELSPYGGSAMLRGLAQSSGFAVVPEGTTPEGAHVQWLPLP
jgi:molybdopterin molybdotransferase